MEQSKQLQLCKTCCNRKFDTQTGIVCSLTMAKPDLNSACDSFSLDKSEKQEVMSGVSAKKYIALKDWVLGLIMLLVFFVVLVIIFPLWYMMRENAASFTIWTGLCLNAALLLAIKSQLMLKIAFTVSCVLYMFIPFLFSSVLGVNGVVLGATVILIPVLFILKFGFIVSPKLDKMKKSLPTE